jgi:hypothetical protein
MALEKDIRPQNLFQKKEILAAVDTGTDGGLLPPGLENTETDGRLPSPNPENTGANGGPPPSNPETLPEMVSDDSGFSSREKTAAPEKAVVPTAPENIKDVEVGVFADDDEYTF